MFPEIPTELIAGLSVFLGCLLRVMLPFFKKQAQAAEKGQVVKWERRYAWTMSFGFLTAFIATMLIFPSFEVPAENIFPVAFLFGWGSQDVLNTIVK